MANKNNNSSFHSTAAPPSQDRITGEESEDFIPPNDDEKDLDPTPMAIADAAYGDDGDDDDLLDLGIRLGKMRLNERIGGFFRPRISEEVRTLLSCPSFHTIRCFEYIRETICFVKAFCKATKRGANSNV